MHVCICVCVLCPHLFAQVPALTSHIEQMTLALSAHNKAPFAVIPRSIKREGTSLNSDRWKGVWLTPGPFPE